MKTLVIVAALAAALVLPATAGAVTVGTSTVYSSSSSNGRGVAQAYRFTAPSSGQVNRLNLYLDGASTASKIEVGLYSGSVERRHAARAVRDLKPARQRLESLLVHDLRGHVGRVLLAGAASAVGLQRATALPRGADRGRPGDLSGHYQKLVVASGELDERCFPQRRLPSKHLRRPSRQHTASASAARGHGR